MIIRDSLNNFSEISSNFAVTIGNFDGVHLGHQKLIKDILQDCHTKNEELVVCTFVPHPKFILANAKNFLINSYEERQNLIEKLGIKYLVEFNFNRDFSTLSPAEFLDNYIFINKKCKALYLGHDFAFGANKAGDHDFVKNYCAQKNIRYFLEKEFLNKNQMKPSSTQIRNFLLTADIKNANNLLGRSFFVSGRVIKGKGRGKTIGFPTANILFDEGRIFPKVGVYKSQVHLKDMIYNSITNIGYNPTFTDSNHINFETHILDFDNDIYGEKIKVEIIDFIRDEMKFSNVNELVKQINLDIKKL